MTTEVISVSPDTPVRDLAQMMAEHRISGVPVIEASGQLVGIVTDGDIYRRSEIGTDKVRRGWLQSFLTENNEIKDYARAHGQTARDVMTSETFAVDPDTSIQEVADILEMHRIRRVPVMKDDHVVGIVSRANLVQALAALPQAKAPESLNDVQIRDLVLAQFARLPWRTGADRNVIVENGIVHVWGAVLSETEVVALRVATENIPGVTGFADHLARWPGARLTVVSDRPHIAVSQANLDT
jgi:CBS domain-containing protein